MRNGRNKMRSALFFIVLVLGGAVACCPCREVGVTDTAFVRDSTIYVRYDTTKVVVRDTIIAQRLEQSNERVETYAQHSTLSNDYCISTADIEADGLLHHSLRTKDSAMLPARVVETEHVVRDSASRERTENTERTEIKQTKKPLTKFVKAQIIGFWVLLAVTIIRLRRTLIRVFSGWRI